MSFIHASCHESMSAQTISADTKSFLVNYWVLSKPLSRKITLERTLYSNLTPAYRWFYKGSEECNLMIVYHIKDREFRARQCVFWCAWFSSPCKFTIWSTGRKQPTYFFTWIPFKVELRFFWLCEVVKKFRSIYSLSFPSALFHKALKAFAFINLHTFLHILNSVSDCEKSSRVYLLRSNSKDSWAIYSRVELISVIIATPIAPQLENFRSLCI